MTRIAYEQFIARKLASSTPTGLASVPPLGEHLFPFQRDLVSWALRRGRAALFASTGLGKTRMELEWANQVHRATGRDVLILCPLAVARQTEAEGVRIGIPVTLCRDGAEVRPGINVTNYDRLHRFDPSAFGSVVLDESSVIKHHDAKTFDLLREAFGKTPFRLAATATPSPNDYVELGTHAEFLGICSRQEMLSEYFVHDGGDTQSWRLKGHARRPFWRWVASWAALVRKPSDLGYENGGYDLPPLIVERHIVSAGLERARERGFLFAVEAGDLSERRDARRASIAERVRACADVVTADAAEPWVLWGDLNAETEALTKAIPGAVEVRGSMDAEEKEAALAAFGDGSVRVLVTKPSIAGWGLNWQHCARVAFVGVSDSFESWHQAIRRCWRFGQTRSVRVHIFASEAEGSVIENLKRKEAAAEAMAEELSAETADAVRAEVRGSTRETNDYNAAMERRLPAWLRGGGS